MQASLPAFYKLHYMNLQATATANTAEITRPIANTKPTGTLLSFKTKKSDVVHPSDSTFRNMYCGGYCWRLKAIYTHHCRCHPQQYG
jgi:hypothetical protein